MSARQCIYKKLEENKRKTKIFSENDSIQNLNDYEIELIYDYLHSSLVKTVFLHTYIHLSASKIIAFNYWMPKESYKDAQRYPNLTKYSCCSAFTKYIHTHSYTSKIHTNSSKFPQEKSTSQPWLLMDMCVEHA